MALFVMLLSITAFGLCFYKKYGKLKDDIQSEEVVTLMTDCFINKPEAVEKFEQLCYEDTGIALKIIHSTQNEWETYLVSKFAVGDTADIVKVSENITPLVKENHIVPLNEYIDKK